MPASSGDDASRPVETAYKAEMPHTTAACTKLEAAYATNSLCSGDADGSVIKEFNELAEAINVQPLVVSVNAFEVLRVHHGAYVVGLNASGPQFSRIGCAHLHDGNCGRSGENFSCGVLQGVKAIAIQTGRRSGRAGIGI